MSYPLLDKVNRIFGLRWFEWLLYVLFGIIFISLINPRDLWGFIGAVAVIVVPFTVILLNRKAEIHKVWTELSPFQKIELFLLPLTSILGFSFIGWIAFRSFFEPLLTIVP